MNCFLNFYQKNSHGSSSYTAITWPLDTSSDEGAPSLFHLDCVTCTCIYLLDHFMMLNLSSSFNIYAFVIILWTAYFTEAGQLSYDNMMQWIVNDDLMDRSDVWNWFETYIAFSWDEIKKTEKPFFGTHILSATNSKPQIRINLEISTAACMSVIWPGLSNKIGLAIFKWPLAKKMGE